MPRRIGLLFDIGKVGRDFSISGLAPCDPLGGSIGDLQSHNAYAYTRNNPLNAVDPLGLREDMTGQCPQVTIDGDPLYDSFGGCTGGWFVRALLSMQAGIICPDNNCSQIRWNAGAGQWEQWVPPLTWTTGDNVTGYIIHQIIGGWETVGTVSDNSSSGSDWILWGYDVNTFVHGVLHGVRQPGQSFTACFYNNANETTGGTIGKIGAAAAALAPFAAAASIPVKNIYQGDAFPGGTISLSMRLAIPAANVQWNPSAWLRGSHCRWRGARNRHWFRYQLYQQVSHERRKREDPPGCSGKGSIKTERRCR